MPVRGVKVGDAFFEVKYDVDTAAALAEMKTFTAAANQMANIDARINTQGLMRNRQTFREAANALGGEFSDAFNNRTANLGDQIARNTERQRKVNQQFEREGNSAARAFTAEADRAFKDAVAKGVGLPGFDTKKMTTRIHKDIDTDSDGWGRTIGRNLTRGFESFASILPGRLESLFSGKAGPVGLAFGGALIAGVAAAAPALGAMISGVIFAAFGLGAVAAGIALVAKDPRVVAAAAKLKDMFHDKIWNGKGAEAFVHAVVPALDLVTKALERWAPFVNRMLEAASKFVGPLTKGLISMVDGFLGPMTRLMESPFMKQLMDIVGQGFGELGRAFGDFINEFLGNKDAMQGAAIGLRDAFGLVAWALRASGKALASLSATWFKWSTDPDGPGPMKSKVQELKEVFADIWEIVKKIAGAMGVLGKGIGDITGRGQATGPNDQGDLKTLLDGLAGKQDNSKDQNGDAKGTGVGKGFWGNQWDDIKAEAAKAMHEIGQHFTNGWNTFHAIWDQSMTKLRTNWNNMWADVNNIVSTAFGAVSTAFNIGLEFIKALWATAWGTLKAGVQTAWQSIVNTVQTALNSIWNVIIGIIGAIVNWVVGAFNALVNWVVGAWNWMYIGIATALQATWAFLVGVWNAIYGFLIGVLSAIWSWAVGVWNNIYAGIAAALMATWNFVVGVWNAVYGFLIGVLSAVWAWVVGVWNNIYNGVANALIAIWNFVVGVWNAVYGFIQVIIVAIGNWIVQGWNAIWGMVAAILNAIGTFIVGTWNAIYHFIQVIIVAIGNWIVQGWNAIWNMVANILNAIGTFIVGTWNAIYHFIQGVVVAIGNWIVSGWEAIRNGTTSIWNAIHGFIVAVWSAMNTAVGAAIEWLKNTIGSALQLITNVWHGAWDGMHKFMAGVWDQIKSTAAAGINGVIDIINGGINLINGVLDKVGVSFKIPTLDHVGGGPGHAAGGRIRGDGHTTQDSIPAPWLSDDEYVIKARSARMIGYNRLDRINQTGVLPVNGNQRYAGGGRHIVWVGAHGDNEGLMNEHRNHVHVAMNVQPSHNPRYNESILQVAQKSGLPLNPVSGFRAGSTGSGGGADHHSEGRATDFAGFNQDALAMYFAKTQGVIELIHRTSKGDYGIFGGGGGGGLFSFLNEWLAKGAGWVIDHMVKPVSDKLKGQLPQNAYGQMAAGSIDKLVDGLKKKIQETIDAASAMDTGGGGVGGGSGQWAGTASQALKMLGMPASWLSGVLTIIGRESGGNPNAVNRTDANAKAGHPSIGLMQTIQPTFDSYHAPGHGSITNPLDNIMAALRYIVARYGSVPAVANRGGGYDNGGWNGPGWSWNGTGKPEMHLNDSQGKALERRISGDGGYAIGELHIHVGGSVSEAEATKIAKKVRDELNKLAGRNGGRSGLPTR